MEVIKENREEVKESMTNNNNMVVEANYIHPVEAKTADAFRAASVTKQLIRAEQKKRRELLAKDEDYAELKSESKRIAAELKAKLQELGKKAEIIEVEDNIDKLKDHLKTEQLTLFTNVDEYLNVTKKNFIEVDDKRRLIEKAYKIKKYKA